MTWYEEEMGRRVVSALRLRSDTRVGVSSAGDMSFLVRLLTGVRAGGPSSSKTVD
jgi:hypothetical protein